MIVKESIFTSKSEDEVANIYMEQYHEKFFIKKVHARLKIYFANDIYRNEDSNDEDLRDPLNF